jgi:ribose 5-phosphate isomerase B
MNMFDKNLILPIGSDHAGFKMKKFLLEKLSPEGYIFKDFGTYSEESVDYPDFIHLVAKRVNNNEFAFGIIICGSGQGASITANKYPNIRAGLCWDLEQARLVRLHNDANVLALPGRFLDFDLAAGMVRIFLETSFEGGRHTARVLKIPLIQQV